MSDAVRAAALIPWLPLASRRPRCSPINTYSITMHPTSHSRRGPSAGGKKEGERQGERLSDRWSRERMNTWQQEMIYSQTLSKLNVAFLLWHKGGITTCNKENPVAVKVNCSFSTATTVAKFHFNKAATKKLISSLIKLPHYSSKFCDLMAMIEHCDPPQTHAHKTPWNHN